MNETEASDQANHVAVARPISSKREIDAILVNIESCRENMSPQPVGVSGELMELEKSLSHRIDNLELVWSAVSMIACILCFIGSIMSCYAWWEIRLLTDGATCTANPSSCVSDPNCDTRIQIYMNYGACFSVYWENCWNWHDSDKWDNFASITNSDANNEAIDVFWYAYRIIGTAVGFSVFGFIVIGFLSFATCIKCCCVSCCRGPEPGKMNNGIFLRVIAFVLIFVMVIIGGCEFYVASYITSSAKSWDIMNPTTWQNYIDAGYTTPDSDSGDGMCDTPSYYQYNWSQDTKPVGAFVGSLICIVSSGLSIIVSLYCLYVINSVPRTIFHQHSEKPQNFA